QYVQLVAVAADVRLVNVVCFEDCHSHSCLMASMGNSLEACTDGYTVAIAAIAILARTIHITSVGWVETGRWSMRWTWAASVMSWYWARASAAPRRRATPSAVPTTPVTRAGAKEMRRTELEGTAI